MKTTFSPAGNVTPLAKRIRPSGPRRSTPNKPHPRSRTKPIQLSSPAPESKRLSESDIFVEDSDGENQTHVQPLKSSNNFKICKTAFNTQRPFSNISNSQTIITKEDTDDDDELFVNYDPDTEPDPCNTCLDPSQAKRKSPVAELKFSRTKRPMIRSRKYSDDIFLEASIDSESPSVIEVPETDSCSSSQPIGKETEDQLEDLIESEDSIDSKNGSFDWNSTLRPNNLNGTIIDESSNDSVIQAHPVEEHSQHVSSTVPENSSSCALADTIIESSSTNSQPLSNPHFPPVNPRAKRLRAKKNGFLNQLNAAVNKAKSNFAFWNQERRSGLATSGTCFEVLDVDRTFGRCLVFVRNVEQYLIRADDGPNRIGLLLDAEMKICTKIKTGVVVEVDLSRQSVGVEVIESGGREILVYPGVQYIRIV